MPAADETGRTGGDAGRSVSTEVKNKLRRVKLRGDNGYSRLVGEVNGYEASVDSLAARVEALDGDTTWVDECRTLAAETRVALDRGAVGPAWQTFHAARRSFAHGLAQLDDGGEALRSQAAVVLGESVSNLGSWRLATVKRLLSDGQGNVRQDVSAQAVVEASRLLDEQYENVHRKRRHLQREFNQLFWLALGSTVLFLALALLAEVPTRVPFAGILEPPFGATAGSATVEVRSVGFAAFVVISGVLGASMFGMRSLAGRSLSTKVPQRITTLTATVARGVIGGASSLFLYVFILSDFVSIAFTPQLLLAIGFVAGYSERLVPRAMEEVAAVTGLVKDQEPADPKADAAAAGTPVEKLRATDSSARRTGSSSGTAAADGAGD